MINHKFALQTFYKAFRNVLEHVKQYFVFDYAYIKEVIKTNLKTKHILQ